MNTAYNPIMEKTLVIFWYFPSSFVFKCWLCIHVFLHSHSWGIKVYLSCVLFFLQYSQIVMFHSQGRSLQITWGCQSVISHWELDRPASPPWSKSTNAAKALREYKNDRVEQEHKHHFMVAFRRPTPSLTISFPWACILFFTFFFCDSLIHIWLYFWYFPPLRINSLKSKT